MLRLARLAFSKIFRTSALSNERVYSVIVPQPVIPMTVGFDALSFSSVWRLMPWPISFDTPAFKPVVNIHTSIM